MKDYLVLKTESLGNMRFVEALSLERNEHLNVSFSEYLDVNEETVAEHDVGETMTCDLYILEADVKESASTELSYKQPVLHSPQIEAVVEISEIVDQWTVLAKSALTSENIIIEFSYPQEFPVGSKIQIVGELSFGEMMR